MNLWKDFSKFGLVLALTLGLASCIQPADESAFEGKYELVTVTLDLSSPEASHKNIWQEEPSQGLTADTKSVLIVAVGEATAYSNDYGKLADVIDSQVMDLASQTVKISLPLEKNFKLFEYTFNKTMNRDEIYKYNPAPIAYFVFPVMNLNSSSAEEILLVSDLAIATLPKSITLTPNPLPLGLSGKGQITATGLFEDGSSQDITPLVSWWTDGSKSASVSDGVGSKGIAYSSSQGVTKVYAGFKTVYGTGEVHVGDAGYSQSATSLSLYESTSASLTLSLTGPPASTVVVYPSLSDSTEASLSASSLTFTTSNWYTAQTLTISGVNDNLIDGTIASTLNWSVKTSDASYSSRAPTAVTLSVRDSNTAGLSLGSYGNTSEAGTKVSIPITLSAAPEASVIVTFTSGDTGEVAFYKVTGSSTSLTFSTTDWSTTQYLIVYGVADLIKDGDQKVTISYSLSSKDSNFSGVTGSLAVTNTE